MRQTEFIPVFVEEIPEEIEEGKLYISRKYETAIHLCACGCGKQSVTSLKAGRWQLFENSNGTVSLDRSIGNFSGENPYHAHYHIKNNKVIW